MGCKECGKPKCNGECGCKSPKVLQINNPAEYITFHKVSIPAAMGDSTTNPPAVGKYKNVLLYYEADQTSWLYSTDGIPTRLTNGITNYEDAINLPQINGHTLLGNQSSSDLGLQGELTAGANIQINDNVISATDTTYTAGNGIELDGTEIKAKIGDGLEFDGNGEINIADIEQYAHFFDTVADMQASTNLIDGSYARTLGYYSSNDGGGALYLIREAEENETANGITTFEVGELIAELSAENEVSIRQGGAKSVSGFDNSTIINTLLTNFKNVYIPQGTFECNGITIKTGNVLRGSGTVTSILKNNSENGTVITNDNNITAGATIKNFAINGNENSADYGIYLDYFTHSSIVENVKINKCVTGCYVTKSWYAQFVNLDIAQCGRGIEINDNSHEINGIQFVDCYVNNITTDYGIYVKTSSHIVNALNIVSCTIENTESHGIYLDSPNNDRIRNVKVDSCYFEGNKGNCIDGKGKDLAIDNCYFHPKSTSQIIINSQFSALNVKNCFEEADVIPSYSIYHTGGLLFCFGYVTNASNKIHVEDYCKAYINSIGTEKIINATLEAPRLYKNPGYGTAASDSITVGVNDTAVDNGAPYEYKLGYDYSNHWFGAAFRLKTSIKGGSTTDVLSVGGRTPKIKVSNSTLIELPKGDTKPTDNISSGCLFFDTTSNKLCYYNGTAWVEL